MPEALAEPANDPSFADLWDELHWRGLIQVSTDAAALRAALAGPPIVFYGGFDPTAPSLHLGNLVLLLTMRRIQLAGHRPLGLVGGSTGLIGDPRHGSERVLNPPEVVEAWVTRLRAQIQRFLSFEGDNAARMVNNLDWTAPLSAIEFLRDVGKHYRVGTMIKKEIVASRLASDFGISYTEFSYQILQGLDFLHLYREYGCALQVGGSDQWGNLTSGTDLIHRVEGVSVGALATPLITDSDGRKFGKSEGNAVWLDAELTSPYAMYQFWLNTADADVIDRLKVFTFLSRAEIEGYARRVAEEPSRRVAQHRLAREVTATVHGSAATDAAIAASAALFGEGALEALDAATLASAVASLPTAQGRAQSSVVDLLVATGLSSSLGDARRAIAQGGVYVNNRGVADAGETIEGRSLAGGLVVLRRGKKTLAGVRVS